MIRGDNKQQENRTGGKKQRGVIGDLKGVLFTVGPMEGSRWG